MSDKLLHNRLDSLFADLEEINELPTPSRDTLPAAGWTFSCDSDQRYLQCSPEIEALLGIPADKFVGEYLPQFALTADSSQDLAAILETGDFLKDLDVGFLSGGGDIVFVRLHLRKTPSQNGTEGGYSGFTQVLDKEDIPSEKSWLADPPNEAQKSGPDASKPVLLSPETGEAENAFETIFSLIEDEESSIEEPGEPTDDFSSSKYTPDQEGFSGEGFAPASRLEDEDFEDEPDAPDLSGLKTLPQLDGDFPDASPGAFTTHFPVDEEAAVVTNQEAGLLDEAPPEDLQHEESGEFWAADTGQKISEDQETPGPAAEPEEPGFDPAPTAPTTYPDTNPLHLDGDLIQETPGDRPPDQPEILQPAEFPSTPGIENHKNLRGETRPFDNLDSLIATLPHTISGTKPLPGPEDGQEDGVPRQKLRTPKGTGILRLSEAITKSGTGSDPAVLTVPIHMQERSIGLLEIIDETPYRDWSEDDRRLVEEIADQLSLALENARLFAQTQKALDETETQAQRLARLNEMSELLSRASHLDEVYAVAGRKTASIITSERVSLAFTAGDNTLDFTVTPLLDEPGLVKSSLSPSLEQTAIKIAIQKGMLVNLPGSEVNGNGELFAVMVAPLLASGRVFGTINVGKRLPGGYGKQDETLLLQIASLLASTIEGRRLFEQTEQALSETEALFQAGAELNAVQSFDDILGILRRYTIVGEQARHASVFLFDRPWQENDIPDWQIRIAQWSISSNYKPVNRLPLREWNAAPEILHQEVPTIIPEIRANPALWADNSPMKAELGSAKSALIIPLNVGRQWIGYIFASYAEARDFPGVNIRRLTSLAGQAAVAIENLRLLEETMSRARQLQTAAEIARDASETLAVDELLNRSVKLIADRFGFYHTSIYLLDEQGKNAVMWASAGPAGLETAPHREQFLVGSKSVVGYVTQTGPLVLNDVRQSPIHEPDPNLPETRAELGIPLKVGERIIGALDVQSSRENPFTPDDVAVLQTLTDQIAVAVDNARSYELAQEAVQEVRQRLQELSMLYNVSQSFASAPLEIAEIANLVARQFVKLLRVPECSVATLDESQKSLRTIVAIRIDDEGEFIDLEDVGQVVPISGYPGAAQALETLTPLVVNLTSLDSDPALQAALIRDGYSSQVIIPLAAKGQSIGIIELKSQGDERLTTPGDLNLAMTLANQAAVALENASLYYEQLRTSEQLREVDTLKTQFLANMSHELRTPLNSIIGFSRVILKGIDGPVTNLQEQDLSAIYNAGQHLLGLINDILDLSKIEAGKMELGFEIINLVELINSVMSTAIGLVKHKPIQLLKDLPRDLPPVNADPLRIRQVLLNLLSNAAKFTDEGTITVRASLQEAPEGGEQQVLVEVTDTGPGISLEDQEKLFQPFTQVDASPTRKTGGSGLGLSISLHLIEMHHGKIGVRSEQDKGSTFYFTLNSVKPEELDGQVPRPINYIRQTGPLPALSEKGFNKDLVLKKTGELTLPPDPVAPRDHQQIEKETLQELPVRLPRQDKVVDGPIILAIDKDPQIVGLYERYLQPTGYQVIPAFDAEQALLFARHNRPALITLDIMVTGRYDGWQLLKEFKADPEIRDIPVIICSILDEREKAFALGADDYLVKPILEADLIEAVEQVVQSAAPVQRGEILDHQPINVLIVDHDTDDIRVLEILLTDNGDFQIDSAADGRQALEAILTNQPDIVILNHLLPDMDAVTFIRTIRANPTIRGLPIILLTETELPEVMKQQLSRNCHSIFHKAKINPEALLNSLLEAAA